MNSRRLDGRCGEAEAAEYLRGQGYKLLSMNYTCRMGEIDIIAEKGGYVAFVEVKQRRDKRFAEAREFVNAAKMERLRRAALMWLAQNDTKLQPRFDVIEVYTGGGLPRIEHIENAF